MNGLGALPASPDPDGRPGRDAKSVAPDVLHAEAMDVFDGNHADLVARWDRFHAFWEARAAAGLDPHQRVALDRGGAVAEVLDRAGSRRSGINFASQDYLSLAAHPALCAAAAEAIGRFGVHAAGPAATQGGSLPLLRLEERLADLLSCRAAIVFPSGWAAGYGTVRALLLEGDHVLIDSRAHACLREGAEAATRNIHRFSGQAPEAAAQRLAQIRATNPAAAILVVVETLCPLDSTVPDVRAAQAACHAHGATLLVAAAHDLGAVGDGGLGFLGEQTMIGEVDIVVGSLAKALACQGGFAAFRRPALRDALLWRASVLGASTALSAVQASVAHAALDLIRSAEGAQRRRRLMANLLHLRAGLEARAFELGGQPSPVVPMLIGPGAMARRMTRDAFARGALVNLVEHPAVARTAARWRLQVVADHSAAQVDRMVAIAVAAREAAMEEAAAEARGTA